MKEKLDQEDIKHVVKLSNLPLNEGEIAKFTKQLSEVIDYNVQELRKVSTDNVEPITNITGLVDVFREDETEPGLTQEEALQNTKERYNGFFKVKAILE
jgi:aspartyl-tRNA(Asn)/glutamyl-tRNA(Gln) amidotransferase subunit C